jgi:hypothetical protein
MKQPRSDDTFPMDRRTAVATAAGIAVCALLSLLDRWGMLGADRGWLPIGVSACLAGVVLWWQPPRPGWLVVVAFVPTMAIILFVLALAYGWYVMGERL